MDFSDLEPLLYQKSMQIVRSVLGIHKNHCQIRLKSLRQLINLLVFIAPFCRYQPVINGVRDHRFGFDLLHDRVRQIFLQEGL